MTDTTEAPDTAGLLYGGKAIAAYLGLTPKTVYHLIERGALPVFRLKDKRTLCARRSVLVAYLDAQLGEDGVRAA
jgi:hypothetical protein